MKRSLQLREHDPKILTKTKTNQGSMKFNEFWSALCKITSVGFESRTLTQNRSFNATHDSGKIVVELPRGDDITSTNNKRILSKKEVHKVWTEAERLRHNKIEHGGKIMVYPGSQPPMEEVLRPKHYIDVTRNSSYILSMMKTILKGEEIEG